MNHSTFAYDELDQHHMPHFDRARPTEEETKNMFENVKAYVCAKEDEIETRAMAARQTSSTMFAQTCFHGLHSPDRHHSGFARVRSMV